MSAESNNSIPNIILFNHPKTRGFKMALLNTVSLPKHIDELRMSDFFNYFDLFAPNETRLDSTISDGLVKVFGLYIVRNDRSRKVGGVCIYLRDAINY